MSSSARTAAMRNCILAVVVLQLLLIFVIALRMALRGPGGERRRWKSNNAEITLVLKQPQGQLFWDISGKALGEISHNSPDGGVLLDGLQPPAQLLCIRWQRQPTVVLQNRLQKQEGTHVKVEEQRCSSAATLRRRDSVDLQHPWLNAHHEAQKAHFNAGLGNERVPLKLDPSGKAPLHEHSGTVHMLILKSASCAPAAGTRALVLHPPG